MTTTPALQMRDVTLEYPDGDAGVIAALDSVNLDAAAGTITSIVGPSGSGKSSLLATAATLIRPTRGSITVGGDRVEEMNQKERATLRRTTVGMIFQQPNLIASLTALEQLVIVQHLRSASARDGQARARELLDVVGLADASSRRPHELSGGQRQRVNIARALMGGPSVLLVDEPTAALDHDRSSSIVRLLVSITREFDLATILVTHETEFVPLTDAVAVMRDGQLSQPEDSARRDKAS